MSVDGSDRASNYQAEQSEQWLGEWMEERGRRDEMVIATKYCGPWQLHDNGKHKMQSNFGGGASKNLHVCVEASLKKLRTSYIDLVSSPLTPSCFGNDKLGPWVALLLGVVDDRDGLVTR